MGRGLFTRTDPVIDGAPAALDTLNELAAALADDANYAATVTTLLAAKSATASNLGDLASVATARTNLGLGTAATTAASAYEVAGAAATAQSAAIAASQPTSATLTTLAAAPVVITPAAAPATNAALGSVFDLGIDQNSTMAAPTNPTSGQRITYRITQTGAGTFTLAWDAAFKFGATIAAPVIAVGAGVTSIVGFVYNATAVKWNAVEVALGV